MNVGQRIKEIREAQGLTQGELSKILNVSTSTLSRYESGVRLPNFDFLSQFSIHFNLPLSTLIESEEDVKFNESYELYAPDSFKILSPAQWSTLDQQSVELIRSYANYVYNEYLKKKK